MVKISVIIPVFNTDKYLAETLDSVLNQTFKEFEVICVDDGCTDNSPKILENYRKKDSRIKVIHQNNMGVVFARNNAINAAEGKYIFPLDSDDIIETSLLEKSYAAITAGKGDVITCQVQTFGRENKKMFLRNPSKINLSCDNCLVNAALFSKSLFISSGGFDPAFSKGLEDWDLWLNFVFRMGAKIYRIPEILFYYRLKELKESRNELQKEYYIDDLVCQLKRKYPEVRRYQILNKFIRFIFYVKDKKDKIVFRVFGITIFYKKK